jgi:hypothetical protein
VSRNGIKRLMLMNNSGFNRVYSRAKVNRTLIRFTGMDESETGEPLCPFDRVNGGK